MQVEYNKVTYEHDQITTVTPDKLEIPENGLLNRSFINVNL